MNVFRHNQHVEIFKSFIVNESIERLEGGNWSVYDGFDIVEEVTEFVVKRVDIPQTLNQLLSFDFIITIVIAERESWDAPIPSLIQV